MRAVLCWLGMLALLLSACAAPPETPEPEEESAPLLEKIQLPRKKPGGVKGLLKDMTLEEKVGQLFFVQVPAKDALEDVTAYHLGGYLLFGRDTRDKTASELILTLDAWQRAAEADTGIPLLIGVDEEGSTVVRVSSNPHLRSRRFSNPRKLWTAGPEALEAETHEKNQLLRALGINVNLNPVADVSTNPQDFMYDRTTGGDAETAAAYTAQVVELQKQDSVGSVLKHFPGYGNNGDTHTGTVVDLRPLETFREQDFLPFQAGLAAAEGTAAVLVSHNLVSCMDPELPASLSPEVHRILRQELGFDGVVMTDDLAMEAVAAYVADGNVAVMSLQAGNDLLVTVDYRNQIPRVIKAVQNGVLPESAVDTACLRVLRWKEALGLLERPEAGTLEPAARP